MTIAKGEAKRQSAQKETKNPASDGASPWGGYNKEGDSALGMQIGREVP